MDSIGALWNKISKTNTRYMSGTVELNGQKINIVAFANDKGDNEKKPDWKLFIQQPRQN